MTARARATDPCLSTSNSPARPPQHALTQIFRNLKERAMVLSLQTVFSNSTAPILRRVSAALQPFVKSRSHVLLFSISPAPSLPADELSELVYYFQSLRAERVGCLSAPAPLTTPAHGYSGTSCTLAVFERDVATPFRSTIPGKETVQVGRWHALRKQELRPEGTQELVENVDWESLWAQNVYKHTLPAGLEDLRYVLCAPSVPLILKSS